jgi:hypothetical protein
VEGIRVIGLKELVVEIQRMPARLRNAESVFATVAAATIASNAREMAATGTRMQSAASMDISHPSPGVIKYGGRGFDMGAEFGSIQYHQFRHWRGNSDFAGYFLWPTVRTFRDQEMVKAWYQKVYTAAIRPIFPD